MVKRPRPGALLAAGVLGLTVAQTGFVKAGTQGSPAKPNPAASAPVFLAPGETVPPFDAEGLDGVVRHVTYPNGSSTVLLFFLSGCPTCHRMLPEWNRAYERRSKNLTVIGILMDKEPPGFFMATPVVFPVLRSPGRAFTQELRVHRVPLTLRVGPGGKVEDVGVGALDPIRLGELFHP